MVDADLKLRTIVSRATFLRERLQGSSGDGRRTETARALLERWRSAVEPEGTDWFEKRLRWDGIEPTSVTAVLTDDQSRPAGRLPSWAVVLREISHRARELATGTSPAPHPSPLDAQAPLPFEHVLLPAVSTARSMLCSRLGLTEGLSFPLLGIVSARAYAMLERGLLRDLFGVSGETLQREFQRDRPFGRSLSLMLDLPRHEQTGDACYRRFVEKHLASGWLLLSSDYPVLSRSLATAVELWSEGAAELLERLVADAEQLVGSFGLRDAPLRVSAIETSLGDRHRRGRAVAIVEFGGGSKVVYKPKPVAMEAGFNHLIEWCNERGSDLKVTKVVDRGEYGWVEFLDRTPCDDEPAGERFYRHAGMLLCLLHLVRATDCHYENVIAHGDQPVLIDAETLLYPDPRSTDRPSEAETDTGSGVFAATVLRTGFLPRWQLGAGRMAAHDSSGLGGVEPHPASRDTTKWDRINTDDMSLRYERRMVAVEGNVVQMGDRTLSPLDYEAELCAGFTSMYRLLMAHSEALSATDGPLAVMRGQLVRFMFRPTAVYSAIAAGSYSPEALIGGVEFGVELEQLARAYLAARDKPPTWPVFAAEVRAIERMDVPLFTTRTDSIDLYLDDGTVVREAFTRPSHDAMLELAAQMSEADLERQVLVIRTALKAKAARAPSGESARELTFMPASGPLPSDELVRIATSIGLEIERHAVSDGKNAVNWVGMKYIEDGDRYQIDFLDDSLYDGASGVALFLAALGGVTGERRFVELSVRSLYWLRLTIRETDRSSRRLAARLRGIGAGVGLGSLIYCLVRTSGLLGTDGLGLLDDAMSLATWLTPEVISDDERLDALSGTAGALLALLALHGATQEESVLQTAVECGEHLLRRRVEARGHRVWRTVGETPLTGFSHGAAGIAYALVRLYAATHDRKYLRAALDGIGYERALFSEADCNWPDLRPTGEGSGDRFPVKWCHGAAGITLARLGCRRVANVQGLEHDIEKGLAATRARFLQRADFVCCGNLGRVETFLVAGRTTADPRWQRLAATGAASVVARAAKSGGFRLFETAGAYNPTFFHGTAGIGYQLLRLASEQLPSVLLWE